jgi:hypothetical protein
MMFVVSVSTLILSTRIAYYKLSYVSWGGADSSGGTKKAGITLMGSSFFPISGSLHIPAEETHFPPFASQQALSLQSAADVAVEFLLITLD